MTSKGLVFALASAMVLGACGGIARPDSRAIRPEPTVAESPATSSGGNQAPAIDPSPTSTAVAHSVQAEPEPAESSPGTPSATVTSDGPPSTTTSTGESIDLAEVRDLLDALDALLGGLDSHIDSVDLEEGETP